MKNFLNACKRRSVILWILLIVWFAACSLVCRIIWDVWHTLHAGLVYVWMLFPIIHLIIYPKPWDLFSVVQIVCIHLSLAFTACGFLFINIPWWVFSAGSFTCLLIAAVSLVLEAKRYL